MTEILCNLYLLRLWGAIPRCRGQPPELAMV